MDWTARSALEMVVAGSPLAARDVPPGTCWAFPEHRTQAALMHSEVRPSDSGIEPFASAEAAWMWTSAALMARRESRSESASGGVVRRPCEPDDVIKALDRLYRHRRIDLAHARILRLWGDRQIAPDFRHAAERGDHRLWREALDRLDWPLRVKGIIG
jgi:hypothetical protein